MKLHLLFTFAIALSGAVSLALSTKTIARESNAEPVRLRVDVDRTVLPANTTESAVVKIGLDCMRPPRHELRPPVNDSLLESWNC